MAKKFYKDGVLVSIEPPFTEAEELDFYRRIGGGPVTTLYGPTSPLSRAAKPSPQSPPKPEEK